MGSGHEKYRLKWSKYESNILSHFQTFLETQALSDVTLFCEGKPVAAYSDPNLNKATGCAEKIDTTCTFDALKCNCT